MAERVSATQREIRHPSAGTAHQDPRYLAIRWKSGITSEAKAALLKDNGLVPAATGLENRRPLLNVNHTEGLSWVESNRRGDAVGDNIIRELERSDHVAWVALAFHEGAGGAPFAVNPTRLYVSQQAVAASGSVNALNAGLEPDDERPSRIPGWVALKVAGASTADGITAVEAARAAEQSVHALRAAPGSQVVRFESIPFYSPTCQAGEALLRSAACMSRDTASAGHWGLDRIAMPRARQFARSGADISIAVIDTGVELNHPQLRTHSRSWNATDNTPDGGPTANHGTACAGVVAGAGPGVRIMSIATATWADVDIAEAIYFAADNGARVISMGFGVHDSWRAWEFELIREALEYAHERGLVLVAAAGNENIPRARFPGSDARTLCVGGSNRSDMRKHTLDESSEKWWGASYGPDVGVVAPCLEMATTDRLGAEGYSRDAHYGSFNGTSAATALVAGLAGLLLSVRPGLTGAMVRRLIERTCDKISPSLYRYCGDPTKPAGPWNSEVGYGRINAEQALKAALVAEEEVPQICVGCAERGEREHQAGCPPVCPPASEGSLLFYESCILDSATFRTRQRLQFRITYEHCLRLVGRQLGPSIDPTTRYKYDLERRGQSEAEYSDLRRAFRRTVNAVSKARLAATPPVGCLRGNPDAVRPTDSGVTALAGLPPRNREWPGNYETPLAGGASVRSVCDAFTQSAVIAARTLAAEQQVDVVNPGHVPKEDDPRVQRSGGSGNAEPSFARRADDVYESSSRVACVQWRAGDEPWRTAGDSEGLPYELRELFDYTITKLPRVGEFVLGERPVLLPADLRFTQGRLPSAFLEAPVKKPSKRCGTGVGGPRPAADAGEPGVMQWG